MGHVRVVSSLDPSRLPRHGFSHVEGPSTALGTALNYCAIRILGMGADHFVAAKACERLHQLGQFVTHGPFAVRLRLIPRFSPTKVRLWLRPLGVNSGYRF